MSDLEAIAKVVREADTIKDNKTKALLGVYQWIHDNPPSVDNLVVSGTFNSPAIPARLVPEMQMFSGLSEIMTWQASVFYNAHFYVGHGVTMSEAANALLLKLTLGDGHPQVPWKPEEEIPGQLPGTQRLL